MLNDDQISMMLEGDPMGQASMHHLIISVSQTCIHGLIHASLLKDRLQIIPKFAKEIFTHS